MVTNATQPYSARKVAPPATLCPAQRYNIKEACALLRISHTSLYKRVKTGAIRSITDGRRRYIPGSEIARLSA
jgi:excisionase family DNA binding protein